MYVFLAFDSVALEQVLRTVFPDTYTVRLPDNLPPTFKGKALKFNYELVVGTCRAGPSGGTGAGVSANSISRVMKVPVRIYNHVAGEFLKSLFLSNLHLDIHPMMS